MKLNRAKVYRACELLETGKRDFACVALNSDNCQSANYLRGLKIFTEIYKEDAHKTLGIYDDHRRWFGSVFDEQNQSARIIALLFMLEAAGDIL